MNRYCIFYLLMIFSSIGYGQMDTTLGYNCSGLDTLETWQGIRYCIVKDNPNGRYPVKGNKILVHYTGYLENGVVFDSSDRTGPPFSFHLDKYEVIRGWDIVFEKLKVGEKARIFIPYKFAYGKQGRLPIIPRKANLIFDVEIIQIENN